LSKELIKKAKDMLNSDQTEVKNPPSKKLKRLFKNKKKISIITAAYNVEDTISTCVESVINQSYPFDQIEFIIVDDNSTDRTKNILSSYAEKYDNITVVFLGVNTGKAAMPRNIGLEVHTTDKVMFLDADDWLHKDALAKMINKMDENNDDFVIGQTIRAAKNEERVHAEFMSYKERNHIHPSKMPYLYYHMGPPSKLMRSSIIMKHSIRFPEFKFGEDKSFFIDVLNNCNYLSVINEPIYYINRYSTHQDTLTRTMSPLEKRLIDLEIIKNVFEKKLPIKKEKVIMKRLIEYDLLKTCDSYAFIRSEEKEAYIKIIKEALTLLTSRKYDIIEEFDSPLLQAGARLIEQDKYEQFIQLFTWYKLDQNKKILIRNKKPFYVVPVFEKDNKYRYIEISLYARAIDSYVENNHYTLEFEVFGREKESVYQVIIRDRKSVNNEIKLDVKIEGNNGKFSVDINELDKLDTSLFTVFLRYDGHKLINIKRQLENKLPNEKRNLIFYTTKANNLGFAIREKN